MNSHDQVSNCMVTLEENLNHLQSATSYIPGEYALLTESQEMHLFADQDVGSLVNNLLVEDNEDWEDKKYVYEDVLLAQQAVVNTQLPAANVVYAPMPNILTSVNTTHPELVSTEEYSGPFDFELSTAPHSGNRNPWVYSYTLNKLFIAMATPFPIELKCKWPAQQLFIRATPIFSLAQHAQDLVTRCIAHASPNETSNKTVPNFVWDHIIRCQNSNAVYQGCADKNHRLSVLVPLDKPQTGTEVVRVLYMFVCKNSCPSGMNRRPTEVVFTLEDEMGQVFGRHSLNIRICSCPKRDKEKEEKIYLKENGSSGSLSGKRRRTPRPANQSQYPVDTKEYTISYTICGKHNMLSSLEHAYNLMAGNVHLYGPNENMERCLQGIADKRKRLE